MIRVKPYSSLGNIHRNIDKNYVYFVVKHFYCKLSWSTSGENGTCRCGCRDWKSLFRYAWDTSCKHNIQWHSPSAPVAACSALTCRISEIQYLGPRCRSPALLDPRVQRVMQWTILAVPCHASQCSEAGPGLQLASFSGFSSSTSHINLTVRFHCTSMAAHASSHCICICMQRQL